MFFPIDSFKIALVDARKQRQDIDESECTIRHLIKNVTPISNQARCTEVLDHFIINEELQSVVITDEHLNPKGIIDRGRITEIFLRPFSRDLLHKKPITEIMDANPIIIDINTNIDDVAKMIIDSDMRHMVSGFIILEEGMYTGMVSGHTLLEEITRRRQRDLYILAHYDQLTGLPNRLLFTDRLQQACQNVTRTQKMLALVFVDLDRFKYYNDTMGHSFGDSLLKIVAERLLNSVRQTDTVARLGGDEFVIILQNIENQEAVQNVIKIIIEKLRLPLQIYEQEIQITASMGLALYPQHDQNIEGLIRKADIAMYQVKQQGRNAYQIYTPEMEQITKERLGLETQLRNAIQSKQLILHYQPQFQIPEQNIQAVEALLRWNHPELGVITPTAIITMAEKIGLMQQIGEWVIKEACRQHNHWKAQGLPPIRIAVNISPIQFQNLNFSRQIQQILQEIPIDPEYLELELTESLAMNHAEHSVKTLTQLRNLGVKLSIDDFGTGYSSLSYLRKFPIDRLKIDQSFIRYIETNSANADIVRVIIGMADSLGLKTLAEGVETHAELDCVQEYQCHEMQGYFLAKPLTSNNFIDWYRQNYPK